MKLAFAPELNAFREEAASWLEAQLSGPFAALRGQTSQSEHIEERRASLGKNDASNGNGKPKRAAAARAKSPRKTAAAAGS